ncbi:hypothetical protein D3C71_1857250 [compost metagenome]
MEDIPGMHHLAKADAGRERGGPMHLGAGDDEQDAVLLAAGGLSHGRGNRGPRRSVGGAGTAQPDAEQEQYEGGDGT